MDVCIHMYVCTASLLWVRNSMPPFLAAFITSTFAVVQYAYLQTYCKCHTTFCFMHMCHDMHTCVSQWTGIAEVFRVRPSFYLAIASHVLAVYIYKVPEWILFSCTGIWFHQWYRVFITLNQPITQVWRVRWIICFN